MCPPFFFFPETTFFIFKWESLELFEFHFSIHSTKQSESWMSQWQDKLHSCP